MPELLQQCGVSLWHCSGVMRAQVALIVAFSSSSLLGLAYCIFLFTIPHRFSMGLRSGELRTGIPWSLNQVLVACVQVPCSVGKWNLHLHKVGQQQEAWSALNFLVYGCVDLGPQKTQWTNTSRWHGTPNHHWLWKLHTGPQATWILCLSSLPPDSGTLISKGNAKFTFIREHNFGPLSSSPVLFVFSPGGTVLMLSVVQEWLDTRNATAETHVLHTSVRSGSGSTDSSCSPLFVNLPHIFEWVLFHNPLQGAVIPIACTIFSTTSFPSLRFSINVLGHRALWTASLFCNDLLCLALLVQGVNGRLLDNCQVSSLPHDCVAYRTRLRDHLKAFAGVLS